MLKLHVKELRSYVKDSTDFIQKINNVRFPYTNIPNNEGIKAVETTLNSKTIAIRIITTFLLLVLTLDNFIFNCQNYLQIEGCAMETKCAPSYANTFMGIFEEKFIYPLINNMIRLYLRFINDIFIIWTGTLDQLLEFKQQVNEVHPSIKFDFKFSNKEVNFLDTAVYKTPIGKLETKLLPQIRTS